MSCGIISGQTTRTRRCNTRDCRASKWLFLVCINRALYFWYIQNPFHITIQGNVHALGVAWHFKACQWSLRTWCTIHTYSFKRHTWTLAEDGFCFNEYFSFECKPVHCHGTCITLGKCTFKRGFQTDNVNHYCYIHKSNSTFRCKKWNKLPRKKFQWLTFTLYANPQHLFLVG